MNFIEFIGFIITIIAFFLLMAKQARDEKRRRESGGTVEDALDEQEEEVRQLLEALHIDLPPRDPAAVARRMAQKKGPPLPIAVRRLPEEAPPVKVASAQDNLFFKKPTAFDYGAPRVDPPYQRRADQTARVVRAIGGAESLKNAVIIKEILGPPKALCQFPENTF